MSQMSFWQKQILYPMHKIPIPKVKRRLKKLFAKRQAIGNGIGWVLGAIALFAMLMWNWKLVIATASGVGLMVLVYVMQGWNWQSRWSHWRQFYKGSQGKLTIAVGSGSLATISTYIAASIWADSENRWLATGSILQGLGTLLTLVLMLWHLISHQDKGDEGQFDQLLGDLTHKEPLKRLIAVRQLSKLSKRSRFSQKYQRQLLEYFRLMLARESEPLIQEAILESLQRWDRSLLPLNIQQQQPLNIPIPRKVLNSEF